MKDRFQGPARMRVSEHPALFLFVAGNEHPTYRPVLHSHLYWAPSAQRYRGLAGSARFPLRNPQRPSPKVDICDRPVIVVSIFANVPLRCADICFVNSLRCLKRRAAPMTFRQLNGYGFVGCLK